MSCEQLHETNIKAITDFISGAIDGAKEGIKTLKAGEGSNKAWTSIAKATSNMTLVFPVLVPRSMPIETAQLIAKACERDDVSMLQVLFSALSVAETSDNGIDYIMSVHKNLKLGDKIDLDDFIDTMNSLPMNENAMISYREAYDMVKEDMNNINFTLPDSISETGLNQCKLARQGSDFLLLEGPKPKPAQHRNPAYEDELDGIPDIEKMALLNDDPNQIAANIEDEYNKYDKSDDDSGQGIKIPFVTYGELMEKIMGDNTSAENKFIKQVYDDYKRLNATTYGRTVSFDAEQYKKDFSAIRDKKETDKLNLGKMTASSMVTASLTMASNKSVDDFLKMKDGTLEEQMAFDMFNMYFMQRMAKDPKAPPALAKEFDMMLNWEKWNDEKARRAKDDNIKLLTDIRKAVNDTREYNLKVKQYNLDVEKFRQELKQQKIRNAQQYEKDRREANSKMLIDTDVKKANELIPTLMNVTFRKVIEGAEVVSSIVVGVKAKLIPLDSSDIIERIVAKNKDNNYFIKFFRATTREISFVKDFIFSIDKAKSDAISFSKKGKSNSIWKVLENRAKLSKAKRIVGKTNSAMAISTLIITAEEAEMLKKMHGIDMYNPSTVSSIMRSYNLMAFGIADDSLETFRIMKDNGENIFETYAYSALEKELRDGVAAKALNVVAKSQR